ncbi:MAG: hypothetical protein HC904_05550, partial [Blastochloris sp.]|nr:hypothetical protein [Blastochloris sp.]
MAKTARHEALNSNRPYEIVMETDHWILRPANGTGLDPEPELSTGEAELGEVLTEELFVPESVQVKIRPWGSEEWEKPQKFVWVFSPTGLCAPHSLRLEREESWMQMSFNPPHGKSSGGAMVSAMTTPGKRS